MKRVLLLINPNARTGATALEKVSEALRAEGHTIIELGEAERGDDPNKLILKYQKQIDVVMVGGGDGSVREALPALVETQIPLAIMPLGTANNLARTFNIPSDPVESSKLLEEGVKACVDLGMANGIFFVNVAGLGISTEINRKVSGWMKHHLGVLAFIITAFQLITRMNPFRAEIITDEGKPMFTKSWQISVCNGKHYGAGMVIKEDASLDDQKLHCLSTEVKKWWQGFFLIPSFMRGRYRQDQEVSLVEGREIRIETRRTFHVDVDGDIKTTTPVTFKVIPKILNLMIPKETL